MSDPFKALVTCPHCATSDNYQVGARLGDSSGGSVNSTAYCRKCNGSFRIEVSSGQVQRVVKT